MNARTGSDADPRASAVDAHVAAFRRLDRHLAWALEPAEHPEPSQTEPHPYRGLYISPHDAARSLSQDPGHPRFAADLAGDPVAELVRFPASSRFATLAQSFGLSAFDLGIVLFALAPEFDLKYERIYAYLHDDVARKRPSADLILDLMCQTAEEKLERRAHFAPDAPLIRSKVLKLWTDRTGAPLPAWSVRLDEQVARYLLHQRGIDHRLASFCRLTRPQTSATASHSSLSDQEIRSLSSSVVPARKSRQPLRLYFQGVAGLGQVAIATQLAAEAGAALLTVELNRWPTATGPEADELAKVLVREAVFQGAVLYLEPWDVLHDSTGVRPMLRDMLPRELAEFNGVAILVGESAWSPSPRGPRGVVPIKFEIPPFEVRLSCWKERSEAAGMPLPTEQLELLANLYRLTPHQIADAVTIVAATHSTTDRFGEPDATPAAFTRAARAQCGHDLARLARRVEPVHGWDDLVLTPDVKVQLGEICNQIRHKRRVRDEWGFGHKLARNAGTSVLFSGVSGTGKTTSASIIARELHLDLYEIDLSRVVSKYIGETEQNLRKIFDAAVNSNVIIQFNECDALWGKRSEVKDAHDRYANIEIAFLLQEMEQFDGTAILTTNLRQNLDDAFTRRLDFLVDFPFPDEAARRRIWEVLLPSAAPREALDLDLLAKLRLSGGNIKNAIYASAFYAAAENRPIRTADLVQALRREHVKMGRLLNESELGSYGERGAN